MFFLMYDKTMQGKRSGTNSVLATRDALAFERYDDLQMWLHETCDKTAKRISRDEAKRISTWKKVDMIDMSKHVVFYTKRSGYLCRCIEIYDTNNSSHQP